MGGGPKHRSQSDSTGYSYWLTFPLFSPHPNHTEQKIKQKLLSLLFLLLTTSMGVEASFPVRTKTREGQFRRKRASPKIVSGAVWLLLRTWSFGYLQYYFSGKICVDTLLPVLTATHLCVCVCVHQHSPTEVPIMTQRCWYSLRVHTPQKDPWVSENYISLVIIYSKPRRKICYSQHKKKKRYLGLFHGKIRIKFCFQKYRYLLEKVHFYMVVHL